MSAREYDSYIQKTAHFQAILKIYIDGQDVSSRLIRDAGVQTDWILDTPELSIFTASSCRLLLDNSDNAFDIKNTRNFFSDRSLPQDGWQVPVRVEVSFRGGPSEPRALFVGFIESIVELPASEDVPRCVEVFILDGTSRLRKAIVDDFGVPIRAQLQGPRDTGDYTVAQPTFDLPDNAAPVSANSIRGGIDGKPLNFFPSLQGEGRFSSYLNASVNLETGQLRLGSEPPRGEGSLLDIIFKTAYRYRTPEFLVFELLQASGAFESYTSDELHFAKSLLHSASVRGTGKEFSSHGRPQVDQSRPLIRWIESDSTAFYLGGDNSLFKYVRRDETTGALDQWTELSKCPDPHTIIQFRRSGNDFYVKTSASHDGRLTGRLWKVTDGETWTEVAGAEPDCSHFYDPYTNIDDPGDGYTDNRKSFILKDGYLYYCFARGTGGSQHNGVRRLNIASGAIDTVFSQGASTQWGIDFTIEGSNLYAFAVQRLPDKTTYLRIYQMALDGGSQSQIFSETFLAPVDVPQLPRTVSDIVVRGNRFYFVLTYNKRRLGIGRAELCSLPVAGGGTRKKHRYYDNSLYAARSLTVVREDDGENIYFVEGTWFNILPDVSEYPTFSDCGHLQKIDTGDNIVDQGSSWRSLDTSDGRGMHTAFSSNLHFHEDGTLHLIAGYGRSVDYFSDSLRTDFNSEASSPENWVWLQFGEQLATKISVLPTNGRTVWQLLEELAITVNYELGWTTGEDEIAAYQESHPSSAELSPKGYIFFRPRNPLVSEMEFGPDSHFGVGSQLDTTLVANYILVRYGNGIWPEKDDKAIEAQKSTRYLSVGTSLLSRHDRVWAEVLGKLFLSRQKSPRLKSRLRTKFAPHLQLGQQIRLSSDWHSLNRQLYQITHIQQNTATWQTTLEVREEMEPPSVLGLPAVPNRTYTVGTTVPGLALPRATGGDDLTLTYSLEGLPAGWAFDAITRTLSFTASEVGDHLLTYVVYETGNRDNRAVQHFQISIVEAVPSEPPEEPEPEPEPIEGDATLEWGYFQPVDVFVNSDGSFSGVILEDIGENLHNPMGVEVALSIATNPHNNELLHSESISSASLSEDGDLSVSGSGITANTKGWVIVQALGTFPVEGGDPIERIAQREIDINLIASLGGGVGTATPITVTPIVLTATPITVTPNVETATPLTVTPIVQTATPITVTPNVETATPLTVTPIVETAMPLTVTPIVLTATPLTVTPIVLTATPLTVTPVVQTATPITVTPNVETATPLTVTPIVLTATPLTVTPVVQTATPITVTPNVETATPLTVTPIIQDGTPLTVTPIVETATPITVTPIIQDGTPLTVTPIVETATPLTVTPIIQDGTPLTVTPIVLTATPLTVTPIIQDGTPLTVTPIVLTATPITYTPIVETATPLTVTPIIQDGTPLTVTPIVLTATPITVTPNVETATPLTVTPIVETATPLTVTPIVQTATPITVSPVIPASSLSGTSGITVIPDPDVSGGLLVSGDALELSINSLSARVAALESGGS